MFALAEARGPRSPTQLAAELELTLGQTSHHVRALRRIPAIQMVATEPRRGAVEHFYVLDGDPTLRALIELLRGLPE